MDDAIARLGGGDLIFYWRNLGRFRTTENGVFGFKAFVQNFRTVEQQNTALLSEVASDRVVYFTREDKIRQAISYARATQTRAWFSGVETVERPEYSLQLVLRSLSWIHAQEAAWERLMQATCTQAYRTTYEIFCEDSERVLDDIIAFMGLPAEKVPLAIPQLEVQADASSSAWVEQFRSDVRRFQLQGAVDRLCNRGDPYDEPGELGPLPQDA